MSGAKGVGLTFNLPKQCWYMLVIEGKSSAE